MRTENLMPYLAGFFDGEGYVGLTSTARRRGRAKTGSVVRYRVLQATATQTMREPLEQLRTVFGGSIAEIYPAGATKRTWCWSLRSRPRVEAMYEALRPYLIVKRTQFSEAIAAYHAAPVAA